MSQDVAIIGMGCLFPRAEGVDAFWRNIRTGVDCITEIPATHWRPDDYYDRDPHARDMTYARRGGFLSPYPFDPLAFGITPATLEATDTSQLFAMVVAQQTLLDAGYGPGAGAKAFDKDRVSCILGVTGALELVVPLGARLGHPVWKKALAEAGVDAATAKDVMERIADGYVGWQEASFPGLLGNVVAGRVASRLDLGGTNCVVDAACASSLSAVHLALMELRSGRADMVVTGGIDTFNDIFMYMCFSKTPALSPTGDARPFAEAADGTILGEGAGCVLLKRLADARRDGDRVYAVIKGMGTSSDGKGQAIYAPSAKGQAKALRAAYRDADVPAATVGLIEGHGTGTKVGDAVELSALTQVFVEAGAPAGACAVGSVKSQIGHTKAAAGAAGLIKATLALHHRVLPPSLKAEVPAKGIAGSPLTVLPEARPWITGGAPRRAGVSAFGFGGSNFHCVLEEAPRDACGTRPVLRSNEDVQIVPFGGTDKKTLLPRLLASPPPRPLATPLVNGEAGKRGDGEGTYWTAMRAWAAGQRAAFKADSAVRAVFVLRRGDDVDAILKQAAEQIAKRTEPFFASPGAWYFDSRPPVAAVAALFPGQGAQYPNMLRELAFASDDVLAALDAAEARCPALASRIYPTVAAKDAAQALTATEAAQPAIGAVSLGLLRLLRRFQLPIAQAAGHSFGEIPALVAAGVLSESDALSLAVRRGALMAHRQDGASRGGMLAVAAARAVVQDLVGGAGLDLTLANDNAPEQVVLAGAEPALVAAEQLCAARRLTCRRLAVSAAFHSPLVADAEAPFAAALTGVTFAPPAFPVYANATAAPYPVAPDAARALLAQQLVSPVRFVEQIKAMHQAGARVFLELGPGRRLGGLVARILRDASDVTVVAADALAGEGDAVLGLARALAELAARGVPLALAAWDQPAVPASKPGMAVWISGANYRKAPPPRPPRQKAMPAPPALPDRDEAKRDLPTKSMLAGAAPLPVLASHAPAASSDAAATAAVPHADTLKRIAPMSQSPTPPPAGLEMMRDAILALQKMQQQSADLHRQFLEGQAAAQRLFVDMIGRQLGQPAPSPAVAQTVTAPRSATGPVGALSVLASAPAPDGVAPAGAPTGAWPAVTAPAAAPAVLRPTVAQPVAAAVAQPVAAAVAQPVAQPAAQPVAVTAPAPAPVAAGAPSAPVPAPSAPRHVSAMLLAVVAEKTGYPAEMLDPSMSLEGDLGIDSIKRVEILSEMQARLPEAQQARAEDLTRLGTLQEIIDALSDPAPQAAAGAPAAAGAQATVAAPAGGAAAATAIIMAIIAEKTGYPSDMLQPEMALEADLGIDSIKRVEIFSALQEQLPAARQLGAEELSSLRTILAIVERVAGAPSLAGAAPAADTAAHAGLASVTRATPGAGTTSVTGSAPSADVAPPADAGSSAGAASLSRVSHLAQDVSAPGATSSDAAAAAAVPHTAGAGAEAAEDGVERLILTAELQPEQPMPRLEPLAEGGLALIAALGRDPVADSLADALKEGGWHAAVVDLTSDAAVPPQTQVLAIVPPARCDDPRAVTFKAFGLAQRAAAALQQQGAQGGAAFMTVSRLGGRFGLDGGNFDFDAALLAGLAGLAKTVNHEWPGVHGRAVDLDPALGPAEAGRRLAKELLGDGPVEVGLQAGGRYGLALAPEAVTAAPPLGGPPLAAGDLVVVTGGGRGVTAAVALQLAQRFQPTLLLLGRSPLVAAEPAWLDGITGDAAMKAALLAQAAQPLTPKELQAAYHEVQAARELRDNLARCAAAGAKVLYRAVDVRDGAAVRALIEQAVSEHGPVRGFVHGAGVLADKLIADKTEAQLAAVYDTKVSGLAGVMAAVDPEALRCLVLFSSSTGRFGRKGQADYAIANEALNKAAQHLAACLPETRVVACNWGPWDGGMVTPALKSLFKSEGLAVIGLDAGAAYLDAELSHAGSAVEVVILGREKGPRARAGASAAASPARRAAAGSQPTGRGELQPVFELTLDPESYPVLAAHVLGGRAVLPAALALEWLALAAVQRNPGLRFSGLTGFQVLKGVTLGAGDRVTLSFLAAPATADNRGAFTANAEIRGTGARGQEIIHARATIRLADPVEELADRRSEAPRLGRPEAPYARSLAEAYAADLFHGTLLQGISEVYGCDAAGIAAKLSTAAKPADFVPAPLREAWLTQPLVLDCCFQLMVLWSLKALGAACLPSAVRRYVQLKPQFPRGGCEARLTVVEHGPGRAIADIELLDEKGELVARLEGFEATVDAGLRHAFAQSRLSAAH